MTASSHPAVVVEPVGSDELHKKSRHIPSIHGSSQSCSPSSAKHDLNLPAGLPDAYLYNKAKLTGLVVAFLYGVCSASMAFANKALLNSYSFPYQFFLIFMQMVVTLFILDGLQLLGWISLPAYSLERGWSFFLPSMLYALHSILALRALSGMNIPMYGVVKRCAPMVILILGTMVLKKSRPSILVITAVAMITVGCLIAGYGDLAFDPWAYMYGGISVVTQSLYLLLVQRGAHSFSATELLHLNCCNTMLPLLLCSVVTGEFQQAVKNFNYSDPGFVTMFILVVCTGCVLNYLLFLCTTLNSALTTSITGTLKAIVQTIVGMFTFGGISINFFTVTGISLNLAGGIIYSFAKLKQIPQREIQWEKIVSVEKETFPSNSEKKVLSL